MVALLHCWTVIDVALLLFDVLSPFVQLFEAQFWDDKAQSACGSKAQCAGVKGGKAQSGGGMAQSKGEGANERRQINGWLTHPSASGQPAQCN
jgi:hypothetical protein